jgi:hypothetical protein
MEKYIWYIALFLIVGMIIFFYFKTKKEIGELPDLNGLGVVTRFILIKEGSGFIGHMGQPIEWKGGMICVCDDQAVIVGLDSIVRVCDKSELTAEKHRSNIVLYSHEERKHPLSNFSKDIQNKGDELVKLGDRIQERLKSIKDVKSTGLKTRQEVFDEVEAIFELCDSRNTGSNETELDQMETITDMIMRNQLTSKPEPIETPIFDACLKRYENAILLNKHTQSNLDTLIEFRAIKKQLNS